MYLYNTRKKKKITNELNVSMKRRFRNVYKCNYLLADDTIYRFYTNITFVHIYTRNRSA